MRDARTGDSSYYSILAVERAWESMVTNIQMDKWFAARFIPRILWHDNGDLNPDQPGLLRSMRFISYHEYNHIFTEVGVLHGIRHSRQGE